MEDEELVESNDFKVNPPIQPVVQSKMNAEPVTTPNPTDMGINDIEYELPDLDILEEAEDFPYELLAKKHKLPRRLLKNIQGIQPECQGQRDRYRPCRYSVRTDSGTRLKGLQGHESRRRPGNCASRTCGSHCVAHTWKKYSGS